MRGMRRTLAAALWILAVGTGAACSDGTTISSPLAGDYWARGSYRLQTVNGWALPYTMRNDASGRVLLAAGQLDCERTTFSQALEFEDVGPSGLATPRQTVTLGTLAVYGSRVVFRPSTGGEFEGTVVGNRLEYTIQGNMGPLVFVFEKIS